MNAAVATTVGRPRLIGVLFIVMAASGVFAHRAQARPLDPITSAEQAQRLQELQHERYAGKAVEQDDGWHDSCRRKRLTFAIHDPLTGVDKQQTVTMIRPDSKERLPVMIVVPTIEGVTTIEKTVASEFCDLKVATIIADVNDPSQPDTIPSWGLEDRNNHFAVMALRTLIDYASTSPLYDPARIGMLGNSLGGITTAMMAGIEPDRLHALVIVVAGGIFPTSSPTAMKDEWRSCAIGAWSTRNCRHASSTKTRFA